MSFFCSVSPFLSSFHHPNSANPIELLLTPILQLLTIAVCASADALARAQRTELNEVDIDGEEFSPDQYHIQGRDSTLENLA